MSSSVQASFQKLAGLVNSYERSTCSPQTPAVGTVISPLSNVEGGGWEVPSSLVVGMKSSAV